MSSDRGRLFAKGDEFLAMFTRGAEFTKELLRENERLRATLMDVEDRQVSAARTPEDWDKLRQELLTRIWRVNPDRVETRTIDMHVARLREKLRDCKDSPSIVVTVHGKGYMLSVGGGAS